MLTVGVSECESKPLSTYTDNVPMMLDEKACTKQTS